MAKTKRSNRVNSSVVIGRVQALALVFFALLALWASFQLLRAELEVLGNPSAALSCDINTVIACSSSLLSPVAHLFFGTSNSVIGLGAFAALLTLAVVLVSGVRLPDWIWWGMALGTAAGLGYVAFFLWKSLTFFKALCPYCMLIWVGTIGAAVIVWGVLLASGKAGRGLQRVGRVLSRYWVLFALLAYLLVVLLAIVGLREQVASLFAQGA